MFSILYGTYFSFQMHFKMSSAICFNLNQFKILSSGNGLMSKRSMYKAKQIPDVTITYMIHFIHTISINTNLINKISRILKILNTIFNIQYRIIDRYFKTTRTPCTNISFFVKFPQQFSFLFVLDESISKVSLLLFSVVLSMVSIFVNSISFNSLNLICTSREIYTVNS